MAQIIKKEELSDDKIKFLAGEIKNGKVFVIKTGTIYGICGNALDEKVVNRIYEIKNREYEKPLIVLVDSIDMLNQITYGLNDLERKITDKFWPGPVTVILKKKELLSDIVTAKKNTVGVRKDESTLINRLIKEAVVPLVAPSANISGNKNITSIDELEDEIKNKVDYIIDEGKIIDDKVSTLIKVENENVEVLREGKIKKEDLSIFLSK